MRDTKKAGGDFAQKKGEHAKRLLIDESNLMEGLKTLLDLNLLLDLTI